MFSAKNLFFGKRTGGYQISRSLRFRSSASAYLSRTFGTPTNNKIFTFSFWVKRGKLGSEQELLNANANSSQFYFSTSDTLNFYDATSGAYYVSTQVFRDVSAWYHIVVSQNTPAASNRFLMYVNGVQVTAFSTSTAPTQNNASAFNVASTIHTIGRYNPTTTNYLDGYLADINFIDGQALTPSSFGENDATTGVWKPKACTVSDYGKNGFYLPFSDATSTTTIGYDKAAIATNHSAVNNWTTAGIDVSSPNTQTTYDSMRDTPTPYDDGGTGRGNYAVLNPLDMPSVTGMTINDGNLNSSSSSSANRFHGRATIGVTSGKWYWEITVISADRCLAGVALSTSNKNEYVGYDASGWGIYQLNGNKYNNQTTSGTSYGSAWTTAGDVLMVALDADNSKIWFGKNNSWFASGDPSAGTNAAFTNVTGGPIFPAIGDASGGGTYSAATNFGQRPFTYTPPSGFKALNTQNLP